MEADEKTFVRINKFLSEAGVCSRREADRLVAKGEVQIDGHVASLGDLVPPGSAVCCRGQEVKPEEERILLAMNKPRGIVCTTEEREEANVVDFLHYEKRIYPIGRLDKESEGLLLLTNQGDIVNKILRAGNYHEKEYLVTTDRPVSDYFLRGMAGGVPLADLGVTSRRCRVQKVGRDQFRIVLTQGINRQIRRMCEYFGYRVKRLLRVRIMNIRLGDLKSGEYRRVTESEWMSLKRSIELSYNEWNQREDGTKSTDFRIDEDAQ